MSGSDGFWSLQFKDVLNLAILLFTVLAIYIGPIRAVKIARTHELSREKRRREFEIFVNLMKTRKSILSPEHVSSLNLIQVEFYGQDSIISAYRNYMSLLSRDVPAVGAQQDIINHFFQEQGDGFFELIHEIGKPLGFILDKRDLERYSYAPQGWGNAESQIATVRTLMIELLSGRRSLPVSGLNITEINKKFPPPP